MLRFCHHSLQSVVWGLVVHFYGETCEAESPQRTQKQADTHREPDIHRAHVREQLGDLINLNITSRYRSSVCVCVSDYVIGSFSSTFISLKWKRAIWWLNHDPSLPDIESILLLAHWFCIINNTKEDIKVVPADFTSSPLWRTQGPVYLFWTQWNAVIMRYR